MVRLLYQEDSHLKEFNARVTRVDGNGVVLDQTAFHPRPSGGFDADTGYLIVGGYRIRVVDCVEESGDVAHVVEDGSVFQTWFGGTRCHRLGEKV